MFTWFPSSDAITSIRPLDRPVAIRDCWAAPGTCGEFVQGRLDGVDFLVNCPIDLFSRASVRPFPGSGAHVADAGRLTKVARLLDLLSARFGFAKGFEVTITSDLPEGKGMASSTADLVAAMGAALDQAGIVLSPHEMARILTMIEPSDMTHVAGVGHVGHLCGTIFGTFDAPADLRVLVLDCGGVVDTLAFDRARAHSVYARNERMLRSALSMALRGLVTGNVDMVARAATLSTRISQQILPKAPLDDLCAIGEANGALGVNCAHSGSVLGLLYRPAPERGWRLREAVERELGDAVTIVGDHRFIAGGVRHVRGR